MVKLKEEVVQSLKGELETKDVAISQLEKEDAESKAKADAVS